MAMNQVQFQYGMSMPDFNKAFGAEPQCAKALAQMRWPNSFHCPVCSNTTHCVVSSRTNQLFQCSACRHQTSLTAGSLFQSTKLPLTIWFLATYLVSQAKTGLSSLALRRQLGVSYPTVWMLHQELMHAMAQRRAVPPVARPCSAPRRLPGRRAQRRQGWARLEEQSPLRRGGVVEH